MSSAPILFVEDHLRRLALRRQQLLDSLLGRIAREDWPGLAEDTAQLRELDAEARGFAGLTPARLHNRQLEDALLENIAEKDRLEDRIRQLQGLHRFDCDLDDDCSCLDPPLSSISSPSAVAEPAQINVCAYCDGSGEAYDPQTGEGPACPSCSPELAHG